MNDNVTQELLPPIRTTGLSGWLDWLTSPIPKRFMLPASGLVILGLDWLLFSEDAATLGLALPLTSTFGFLAGTLATYHLQRRHAQDRPLAAVLKAILAGVLVAVPFPLAGTLAGAWILANSGLAGLKTRLFKERFFGRGA
jgi:hypothetical protein